MFGTKVSFASTTLNYPIFAAEFDPYNRGYLVVGGGGGESKTGVPNQISVLDVSDRATISTVADVELSRDEDSVQSIGSLATKDGLITLAGINSSQAQQNDGKNEHFRAFDVRLPPRKRQKTGEVGNVKGESNFLGKRSLFKPVKSTKKEAYQRILRLSPASKQESGSKRIGAVASGMSSPAEIVVFNATTALPDQADVLSRIETSAKDEVIDLDIANADLDRFSIAWCTDYEVHEQTFEYDFRSKKVQKTPKGPRRVHQMEEAEQSVPRSKLRSVRFLDAQNVLVLINRANKKGAELRVIHLYPTGPAMTTLQMRLPNHIKQAVSMDVCTLDADSDDNKQIIIAVAGQDISIETYTLNHRGASDTFSRFTPFQTFRDVHKHQMTKVCFSPFHSPARASTEKSELQNAGPQYVRLASVSYGNSVVVDTFPLSPLSPTDRQSRYVLVHPNSHERRKWLYIALISFMVLVAAVVGQAYLGGTSLGLPDFSSKVPIAPGIRPSSTVQDMAQEAKQSVVSVVLDTTSTASVLAADMQESAASVSSSVGTVAVNAQESAASVVGSLPTEVPGVHSLQDLLDLHPEDSKAVVVKDDGELSVDVHDDKTELLAQDPEVKHWDDLHEEQRRHWRERLVKAGRWAESEGETVLKGILWSQYAGIVGNVAGDILREL